MTSGGQPTNCQDLGKKESEIRTEKRFVLASDLGTDEREGHTRDDYGDTATRQTSRLTTPRAGHSPLRGQPRWRPSRIKALLEVLRFYSLFLEISVYLVTDAGRPQRKSGLICSSVRGRPRSPRELKHSLKFRVSQHQNTAQIPFTGAFSSMCI